MTTKQINMNRQVPVFILWLFIFGFAGMGCSSGEPDPETDKDKGITEPVRVKTGAEVLISRHLGELDGRRVGLVMNPTARIRDTHMLDTLLALDVDVTALFAPEHGFRGEAGAGEIIEDGVDQATGLPVYSLYGKTKKPTPGMLQQVDLLIFDMQDVGGRFYTYNVTLGRILESAAASDIPVWVLDRPNPAGGSYMAGWVLDERFKSFVGAWPIPMAHGMTLGELATMMVGEGWLDTEKDPELRVIRMANWERDMTWNQTGLAWYPPSPNLPAFEHAYLYLGTVLFEGSTISEGRGTADPFLTLGSPNTDISSASLMRFSERFPSVEIEPVTFTPESIPGKATNPKYEGMECRGLSLSVKDYSVLDPVTFGVELLEFMMDHTQGARLNDFIYKLAGSEEVQRYEASWDEDIASFREKRAPYLLY